MTKIVPASIRNRNAGAMYPGASSKKFGSSSYETLRSKDGVHKIATFPSHIQGAAALFDLLSSKAYTGRTIQAAITKWCGAFYVSTYIRVLEDNAGVKRTDMLTRELLADPSKAIPIAKAMALQEAGRDYPMTDEEWATAHSCCFVEQVAPSFAPDNDVPTPKPETRMAEASKPYAAIGVVAASAGAIPSIPAAPAGVLDSLTSWGALSSFVTSNVWLVIGVVAAVSIVWLLPKFRGVA